MSVDLKFVFLLSKQTPYTVYHNLKMHTFPGLLIEIIMTFLKVKEFNYFCNINKQL